MSIQNILNRKGSDVVSIRPDASVKSAADLMRRAGIAALVMKSGGAVVGVFTERDVVTAISEFGQEALLLPVKAVVGKTVISITASDSVKHAMSLMTRHRVRHLPVIEGSALRGIVSIGDIVKSRLEDLETETNVLRDVYWAAQPNHLV